MNQDGNFKKKLIKSSSLRLLTNRDAIFLPKIQQVEVFFQSANILENRNENLQYALQLVKGALQTINKEKIDASPKLLSSLKFLDGKLTYRLGKFNEGIVRMNLALDKETEGHFSIDDIVFFVKAIFDHGSGKNSHKALTLFAKYGSKSSNISKDLVEAYSTRVKSDNKKESVDTFVRNITSSKVAYWFVSFMWDDIKDTQSVLIIGDQIISVLKLASTYTDIEEQEKSKFFSRTAELIELFNQVR